MSVFRQSFPVIGTSFVNKVGAIGINLLPMLLVDRQIGGTTASIILGTVKAAVLLGSFAGGIGCDYFSARTVVLASFALSAIGLAGLPLSGNILIVTAAAFLAQFGTSLFQTSSRLLLVQGMNRSYRQEAIAWLRSGNNMGQIVSYSVGMLATSIGMAGLIYFDAATSALAYIVGLFWLPRVSKENKNKEANSEDKKPFRLSDFALFLWLGFLAFGYTTLYEAFMIGSAGKFRLVYGEMGLSLYSSAMVINTVLCTLLAIPAARWLKRADVALPAGIVLLIAGGLVLIEGISSLPLVYLGITLLTAGEIAFGAVLQFTLMESIPAHANRGHYYGIATTVQASGRILAGVIAFPLIVEGDMKIGFFLAFSVLMLMAVVRIRRPLRALMAA